MGGVDGMKHQLGELFKPAFTEPNSTDQENRFSETKNIYISITRPTSSFKHLNCTLVATNSQSLLAAWFGVCLH